MKVVCLNCWGGKLYESLLAYLSSGPADIVCLQEVVHSPGADRDWLTYRDGDHVLRQRARLFSDLALALPDHVAVFCPAAQGPLWEGDVSFPSQWGLATFVHKSMPIIGQVQGFIHKAFSADGFGEHPRSRNAHGIRVYDFARHTAVSVTHAHGLRDTGGKQDTPERAHQARRILAIADSVAEPGDLRIICGDFNVEPHSETLALFAERGFTELVTARGFAGTRTSFYEKPGRFADYMLVNRGDAVTGFEVVYDPEVSDHCPLVLSI